MLAGIASVIDGTGKIDAVVPGVSAQDRIATALAADWMAVGDDVTAAMKRLLMHSDER